MVNELIAVAVLIVAGVAEFLHHRRCRRLSSLAFAGA